MAHSTDIFAVAEDPFFVQDLVQMSKAENYRRWQIGMVSPYVRGRVLEVGGGIGSFTTELARLGKFVISIEPNDYCHAQLVQRTGRLPNVRVYHASVEDLDRHLTPADRVDTVVLMNVLEHIKDDHAVLQKLVQRLRPEGRLVVLVPAGPWAFGRIDERLGHYRRYSKRTLRELVVDLSLELERIRYFNFLGIWAWWWNAKVTRRENQDSSQIRLFDRWFVPCISRIENLIPPPLGQSLLVVGRQPDSAARRLS